MGICTIFHLILKLSISVFKGIESPRLFPSLTPHVLCVSPTDLSAGWTSWCMHLPNSDRPGGFLWAWAAVRTAKMWHAPRLRVRRSWHFGSQRRVTGPPSLGRPDCLFKKRYSNWKEIAFIILPPKHSYLFFCGSSQSLSICVQSLCLHNFLLYFAPQLIIP